MPFDIHNPADAYVHEFRLDGEVAPLLDLRKSAGRPDAKLSRPMGGWLMTYGQIGSDGVVVPTRDRDGHVSDVASQLGLIDWTAYLKGGRWNDTHHADIIVGLPDDLEFHDGTTPMSKAHGKVGFWTRGHLFDRHDTSSWDGLGRTPTEHEFERADHFWQLAQLLKGTPRPIALSAHGKMALSPCKSRIIYAQVGAAAVCEIPKNPDSTLEILQASWKGTPLEVMRKGMVGRSPCRTCSCPVGACEGMFKAAQGGSAIIPEDLEGAAPKPLRFDDTSEARERLLTLIERRYLVDRPTAIRWLKNYVAANSGDKENSDAHG
jgi:hypothetical protein